MAIEMLKAEELDSTNVSHLEKAAEVIMEGGIAALPFNGVFGLFGNIDNPRAINLILEAKARPRDKKLVATCLPEFVHELADFRRSHFSQDLLIEIWKDVHALGAILPASTTAPYSLVITEGEKATILPIWTEYQPMRYLVEHLRKLGGRALVGTSANKSGQPTHWRYDELYEDFNRDVHAIMKADFSHLPEIRRKSTSVIDFTNSKPRLHREGNVSEEELHQVLAKHGLTMHVDRDVIVVRGRDGKYPTLPKVA